MFRLVIRNSKKTGNVLFYDQKESRLSWFAGPPIDDFYSEDVSTNQDFIVDFIQSLKTKRKITELEHYHKFREECLSCPVVHLCKGTPLLDDPTHFKNNCDLAYVENVQKLFIIINLLTKSTLEVIEGEIVRPE